MSESYSNWMGWTNTEFGRFSADEALYYALELKMCGIPNVDGLKIGEIGFGNGAFAGWARDAGAAWIGREALSQLQEKAARAGFPVIGPEVLFSMDPGRNELDALVAFDVIEHMALREIEEFLREAHDALRPGGAVVARLPSGDSPYSGAIFRGDVTHRTLLGSSAVGQLARDSGFEVAQIRSPVVPLRGAGIARCIGRALRLALQRCVFAFVRTVVMTNRNAILSPNMVVVLRKTGSKR